MATKIIITSPVLPQIVREWGALSNEQRAMQSDGVTITAIVELHNRILALESKLSHMEAED